VEISREFRDAMLQHAAEEHPNECCGMLGLLGGKVQAHYRVKNTHPSPYRYEMDAKEHFMTMREVDDAGWEQAFYHSHSHSPAFPSETDIRLATWSTSFYLIVSPHVFDGNGQQIADKPQVRAFLIEDGQVTEEPVVIPGILTRVKDLLARVLSRFQ
jgi:proteasome lid subunit RPN8/RPN11